MKKRVTCGFLLLFLALCLSFAPRKFSAAYPAAELSADPSSDGLYDRLSRARTRRITVYETDTRSEKEEAHDAMTCTSAVFDSEV